MNHDKVCVTIVTCNSGRYIRRCLESVLRQEGVPLEVIVVDNASTDNTREILEEFQCRTVRTIYSDRNLGFAEGQNQAIRAADAEWVLTLNPDVLMRPGFLRSWWTPAATDSGVGAVCGKLLSIGPGFEPLPQAAHRFRRHLLHARPCAISTAAGTSPMSASSTARNTSSGPRAAAALYRRAMIDDISRRRRILRSRFLRLSRGCRCGLARHADGLALSLYSRRHRLSRAHRESRAIAARSRPW